LKKFQRETSFLLSRIGLIFTASFAAAFVGTLVWVNGRGAWFVMRFARLPEFAPSISLAYTLWLAAYGLMGASIVIICLTLREGGRRSFREILLQLAAYLFSLLWHPFFYSAHFLVLSFVVLLGAAAANVLFFIFICRRSLWLSLSSVIVFLIQMYFMVFTLACFA